MFLIFYENNFLKIKHNNISFSLKIIFSSKDSDINIFKSLKEKFEESNDILFNKDYFKSEKNSIIGIELKNRILFLTINLKTDRLVINLQLISENEVIGSFDNIISELNKNINDEEYEYIIFDHDIINFRGDRHDYYEMRKFNDTLCPKCLLYKCKIILSMMIETGRISTDFVSGSIDVKCENCNYEKYISYNNWCYMDSISNFSNYNPHDANCLTGNLNSDVNGILDYYYTRNIWVEESGYKEHLKYIMSNKN